MSTVLEIEKAIETLPTKQFFELVEWMEQKRDAEEDAYDNVRAQAALVEGGPNIPWEEVKKQMGWQ